MRDVARFLVGQMADQAQSTAAWESMRVTGKENGEYICTWRGSELRVTQRTGSVPIGGSLLVARMPGGGWQDMGPAAWGS